MVQKLRVAILLCLPMCLTAATSPAVAETYETYVSTSGAGDDLENAIGFNSSCGEECHVADMICSVGPHVRFSLTGFEAKQAASMITNAKPKFALKVGGAGFDFSVRSVAYEGEMTGDWTVDGELNGDGQGLLAALGKAKSFKATVGSQSITLPVNKDVVSWAKACPN
jgi:hypothetical protein